MGELVSVIIPVYNTEKYIKSCVQSVLCQTYEDLEIILVDDGSTDSSAKICDELAETDKRISVFHKKNEGLGLTRNYGLKHATGNYVSFLDSDDYLDKNTYEYCIKKMKDSDANACYFGRKSFDKDGKISINDNVPQKLTYCGKEVSELFVKHYIGWFAYENSHPYIQESVCCALYERSIIQKNHIEFFSEREVLSEDAFFNMDICKYANSVIIVPKNFYYYRYNFNSLTKKYDAERFKKILGYKRKLNEYIKMFPQVVDAKRRIQFKFISLVRGLLKNEIERSRLSEIKETMQMIKFFVTNDEVQKTCKEIDCKKFDRNTKIFLKWIIHKQYIVLYIFYKGRKVFL